MGMESGEQPRRTQTGDAGKHFMIAPGGRRHPAAHDAPIYLRPEQAARIMQWPFDETDRRSANPRQTPVPGSE